MRGGAGARCRPPEAAEAPRATPAGPRHGVSRWCTTPGGAPPDGSGVRRARPGGTLRGGPTRGTDARRDRAGRSGGAPARRRQARPRAGQRPGHAPGSIQRPVVWSRGARSAFADMSRSVSVAPAGVNPRPWPPNALPTRPHVHPSHRLRPALSPTPRPVRGPTSAAENRGRNSWPRNAAATLSPGSAPAHRPRGPGLGVPDGPGRRRAGSARRLFRILPEEPGASGAMGPPRARRAEGKHRKAEGRSCTGRTRVPRRPGGPDGVRGMRCRAGRARRDPKETAWAATCGASCACGPAGAGTGPRPPGHDRGLGRRRGPAGVHARRPVPYRDSGRTPIARLADHAAARRHHAPSGPGLIRQDLGTALGASRARPRSRITPPSPRRGPGMIGGHTPEGVPPRARPDRPDAPSPPEETA
ncbi:hypothetical protein ACVWXB_002258 [Streptomyces sp. TE12347]